ncbi:hypothetical protein [Pseudonocardia sp. GCM10023141]|uniref:hypothetical protein n=1 Tax=Pseudonocardia sp. GCM10023141 TaxID=3252653 RepID=UPI003605E052
MIPTWRPVPAWASGRAVCPFGVVLRGPVPAAERERFRPYQVPDGPQLLLLAAALTDFTQQFVAVIEAGRARFSAGPALQRVVIRGPVVPDLGALATGNVVFERGPARLVAQFAEPALPWVIGR